MAPRLSHSPRRTLALALLLAMAAGVGCAVGPEYHRPDIATPASFTKAAQPGSDQFSRPQQDPADLKTWWEGFCDPELTSLVGRVLAGNLQYAAATSRIRAAREEEIIAQAALWPQVNASGSAERIKLSQNSIASELGSISGGGSSGGSSGGGSAFGLPGDTFNDFTLGLDASWELDIFGKNRRAAQAAHAQEQAQVWSQRDTAVSLAAEVANDYLGLRGDQLQLALNAQQLQTTQGLIDVVKSKADAGVIAQVNFFQQRSQIASIAAQSAALEASIDARIHALSILLGQDPETLRSELQTRAPVPPVPPVVPVGIPSELLRRRPDIRKAERELAASTAQVGEATAQLYPSFSITGSFTLESLMLNTLLEGHSFGYRAGASIMWPVFEGGRLRAQLREAKEQQYQALLAYLQAILAGLGDVADALSRYGADQRRLAVLLAGVADADRATELSQSQYEAGVADFQVVLNAQSAALQLQTQVAQSRVQLNTDLVALYKALGGGWEDAPQPGRSAQLSGAP